MTELFRTLRIAEEICLKLSFISALSRIYGTPYLQAFAFNYWSSSSASSSAFNLLQPTFCDEFSLCVFVLVIWRMSDLVSDHGVRLVHLQCLHTKHVCLQVWGSFATGHCISWYQILGRCTFVALQQTSPSQFLQVANAANMRLTSWFLDQEIECRQVAKPIANLHHRFITWLSGLSPAALVHQTATTSSGALLFEPGMQLRL